MNDTLTLNEDVKCTIAACVRAARGTEICGYVLVDRLGRQEFISLENRSGVGDGCFVAAQDVARAKRFAKARNTQIAAFVHSHPFGTSLSEVDRVQQLASEALPWIVVSLSNGALLAECHPQ